MKKYIGLVSVFLALFLILATRSDSSTPTSEISSLATPIATRISEINYAPSVGRVTLQKDGASWSPAEEITPQKPAMSATGTSGILWIKFPSFEPYQPRMGLPIPTGDYIIMFSPSTRNIEYEAKSIATLKGATPISDTTNTDDLYLNSISAVADGHFLVEGYSQPSGSQSGATNSVWWVEPATQTFKKVASGVLEGGGNFGMAIHSENWLFWNQYHFNASNSDPLNIEAHPTLINLKTGAIQELKLGGDGVTPQASWEGDMLHYTLQGDQHNFVFDPATDQITQSN